MARLIDAFGNLIQVAGTMAEQRGYTAKLRDFKNQHFALHNHFSDKRFTIDDTGLIHFLMNDGKFTIGNMKNDPILPAAIIYKKHRTFKGALLGILVGTLLQIVIAMLSNVYLMIPFYEFVMGFKEGMLLGLMQKANPAIRDVGWSYALFAVLPFNAIKDAAIIIITLLVYKPLHRFIEKIHA